MQIADSTGEMPMWYAVYLVYRLAPESELRPGQRVQSQEDLLLLERPSHNAALRSALEIGAHIGRFGQQLLDQDPGALSKLGLPAPFRLLHPGNVDVFRAFTFLGVRDIVVLQGAPGDETQIDFRELEPAPSAEGLARSLEDTQAFIVVGRAYSGASAVGERERLYARYSWYLADQIYQRLRDPAVPASEGDLLVLRRVLLHATRPEEALRRSSENASEWEHAHPVWKFVGLRQLSLVDDDLCDSCELAWTIGPIDVDSIRFPWPAT